MTNPSARKSSFGTLGKRLIALWDAKFSKRLKKPAAGKTSPASPAPAAAPVQAKPATSAPELAPREAARLDLSRCLDRITDPSARALFYAQHAATLGFEGDAITDAEIAELVSTLPASELAALIAAADATGQAIKAVEPDAPAPNVALPVHPPAKAENPGTAGTSISTEAPTSIHAAMLAEARRIKDPAARAIFIADIEALFFGPARAIDGAERRKLQQQAMQIKDVSARAQAIADIEARPAKVALGAEFRKLCRQYESIRDSAERARFWADHLAATFGNN